jgi:hypothetical protein
MQCCAKYEVSFKFQFMQSATQEQCRRDWKRNEHSYKSYQQVFKKSWKNPFYLLGCKVRSLSLLCFKVTIVCAAQIDCICRIIVSLLVLYLIVDSIIVIPNVVVKYYIILSIWMQCKLEVVQNAILFETLWIELLSNTSPKSSVPCWDPITYHF